MSSTGAEIAALVIGSGGLGWFASAIVEFFKGRHAARDADVRLEEHRDELTFRLLEAARTEVSELRQEIQRLRPVQTHLLHFDEALMHVERLLAVPFDSANRAQVEREARAFLRRLGKSFASEDGRSIDQEGTE